MTKETRMTEIRTNGTPKTGGSSSDCDQRTSVLECGGAPPLSMGARTRNLCDSWKAPFRFFRTHGAHEPVWGVPSIRSPAFRRFGPAKAGTPNRRFMESPLAIFDLHWDQEPETRKFFRIKARVFRFMERAVRFGFLGLALILASLRIAI